MAENEAPVVEVEVTTGDPFPSDPHEPKQMPRMIGNFEVWARTGGPELSIPITKFGVANAVDDYDSDDDWAKVELGIDLSLEGIRMYSAGVSGLLRRMNGEPPETDDGYQLRMRDAEKLAKIRSKLSEMEPLLLGFGR